MTLAERVTAARARLSITQSELARRAGLTVSAIWQIENGDRKPALPSLLKLVEALGVSADWLLGREEADAPVDLRLARIIRGWERLSQRDREAIFQLYRALAEEAEE